MSRNTLTAGNIIGRFAEYMGISRREARQYVEQETDEDETIEIPPA